MSDPGNNGLMQCGVCGFVCSVEHWSLLRRKMTREEADRLLGGFRMAQTDWERGVLTRRSEDIEAGHASWDAYAARVVAALTGEKT
jgi:hypothetical protein